MPMSFWKKSMEYLGLGPDDAYDDYDDGADPEPPSRHQRSSRDDGRQGRSGSGRGWPAEPDSGTVSAVPARPSFPSRDFDASRRTPGDESGMVSRPRAAAGATRQAPPPPPAAAEPATVRPRRFDQAQELADRFKEGNSVILNLESADRDVARRLIDFASGVCYSLDGTMEKVATGVYLLKPAPARVHRFDDYES
jgi:cell division inhibitor SepF